MMPILMKTLDVWSLYCDKIKLMENITTFTEAFQAWFAAFWVFQVEYPSNVKNTCMFLEKYIVGHQTTVSGPVTRLANKVLMPASTQLSTGGRHSQSTNVSQGRTLLYGCEESSSVHPSIPAIYHPLATGVVCPTMPQVDSPPATGVVCPLKSHVDSPPATGAVCPLVSQVDSPPATRTVCPLVPQVDSPPATGAVHPSMPQVDRPQEQRNKS